MVAGMLFCVGSLATGVDMGVAILRGIGRGGVYRSHGACLRTETLGEMVPFSWAAIDLVKGNGRCNEHQLPYRLFRRSPRMLP
jgi:hypothetical protein